MGVRNHCQTCKKACFGEVLKVRDMYFHVGCFNCAACKNSLAQGGFFCKDGDYYCIDDYQKGFGTKCSYCGQYIEGEAATALGNVYHQKCLTCGRCGLVFSSGDRLTWTENEILCHKCVRIPVKNTHLGYPGESWRECSGCGTEVQRERGLVALGRQWHVGCFKCTDCGSDLRGEYIEKDGAAYCERDYQNRFGIKCAYCSDFITGKVLEAGKKHHFHPNCARCRKCGGTFNDGDEMYLQGRKTWHPRCGTGTMRENNRFSEAEGELNGETRHFDSSALSELQFSLRSGTPELNGTLDSLYNSLNRKCLYQRTSSPGIMLREYKSNHQFPEDVSSIHAYSYLTEEPNQGYLKRPIEPYDRAPTCLHFHRPLSQHLLGREKLAVKGSPRPGMRAMVERIQSEALRGEPPNRTAEEALELAKIPDAKRPNPGETAKIERDDFPAPPYAYTDPDRRRRMHGFYGTRDCAEESLPDEKPKREEEVLRKMETAMGKLFLQNVKEREKMVQSKPGHLNPINASRIPSAGKEPSFGLRYRPTLS